MIMNHLKEIKL